jgi:hypothetical protein
MTSELHAKAVAIDTVIAAKHAEVGKARFELNTTIESLRWYLNDRRNNGVHALSLGEVLDKSRALVANPDGKHRVHDIERHLAAYETRLAAWKAAVADFETENDKYEGWSRFFLVLNNNGHIHSTMTCHTCFVDTDFSWLYKLSGLTEAEAVEAHGEILCSVCFPSAPVEWTTGTSKVSKEAKAARVAAKAEREAKKLEKALLPDGRPLDLHDDRLTTLAAAKSWLTNAYEWNLDHPSYPVHEVEIVAAAVAAKTGETVEVVKAAAAKRAAKRAAA